MGRAWFRAKAVSSWKGNGMEEGAPKKGAVPQEKDLAAPEGIWKRGPAKSALSPPEKRNVRKGLSPQERGDAGETFP